MTNELRNIRNARGLTLEEVAEAVEATPTTISKLERGPEKNGMELTRKWAMKLAKVYNCSLAEIFGENNTVPLVGYVGAGAEVIPIDDCAQGASLEEIEAPQGLNLYGYVAVRVRGDSMYPRYFENEVIAFKRNVDWSPECLNKECVVKLKDGRCFVKIVRAGSKDGLFTLESFNAPLIYDVEIEWACCKLVRL